MKKILFAVPALLLALAAPAAAHGPKPHAAKAETAGGHHHHEQLQLTSAQAPRISLRAEPDAKSGFNFFVSTENFAFAPELVNNDHSDGKGHAHIYVDGAKIGRLYGTAFHLEGLAAGEHEIEVTLNANDHREFAVDGKRVSASVKITAP